MKNKILLLALILFFQFSVFSENPVYRYGIFVSSSRGYNEVTLKGAKKKVAGVRRTFTDYCLLEDFDFLDDPTRAELTAAFEKASLSIKALNSQYETQFFFYYFGHGLPGGLMLGNELYNKKLLQDQLNSVDARLKCAIIDACSSEIMGTGGYLDFRTQSAGTVFITSSSLFEQAFSDIFTPFLKAGLMGDADGFIPPSFATNFFFNEIESNLEDDDKEYMRALYGFKEYYDYLALSPRKDKEVMDLFASMGIDHIPSRIHFRRFYDELIPQLKNSMDKELLFNSYDYSDVCKPGGKLSSEEKEKVREILGKVGFKKDNFVTLSEIFSYVHTLVTQKGIVIQTPTINTNSLVFEEPVRLSYNQNKTKVTINYGGTIFIKRVNDRNLLDHVITLASRLDDGSPFQITLAPGSYVFIIEVDGIKYRLNKKINPKDKVIVITEKDWASKVVYYEAVEENFFSYSITAGISHSVLNNKSLNMGVISFLSLLYNFSHTRGNIGVGVLTGFNRQTSLDSLEYNSSYVSVPIALYGKFTSYSPGALFFSIDLGAGYFYEQIFYGNEERSNDWGSRLFFTTGLGVGMKFQTNKGVALKYYISSAANFYNLEDYILTGYPGIEYSSAFFK